MTLPARVPLSHCNAMEQQHWRSPEFQHRQLGGEEGRRGVHTAHVEYGKAQQTDLLGLRLLRHVRGSRHVVKAALVTNEAANVTDLLGPTRTLQPSAPNLYSLARQGGMRR